MGDTLHTPSVRLDSRGHIADNPAVHQSRSPVQESAMRTTDFLTLRDQTSRALQPAPAVLLACLMLSAAGCQSMGFGSLRMPHM